MGQIENSAYIQAQVQGMRRFIPWTCADNPTGAKILLTSHEIWRRHYERLKRLPPGTKVYCHPADLLKEEQSIGTPHLPNHLSFYIPYGNPYSITPLTSHLGPPGTSRFLFSTDEFVHIENWSQVNRAHWTPNNTTYIYQLTTEKVLATLLSLVLTLDHLEWYFSIFNLATFTSELYRGDKTKNWHIFLYQQFTYDSQINHTYLERFKETLKEIETELKGTFVMKSHLDFGLQHWQKWAKGLPPTVGADTRTTSRNLHLQ